MILPLLAGLASAGPPVLEAHVHGATGDGEHADLAGGGVGVGVALPLGVVWPVLRGDVGVGAEGTTRFDWDLALRLHPVRPRGDLPAFSLVLAGGSAWTDRAWGLLAAGAGLDVPVGERIGLRVQGIYQLTGDPDWVVDPVALRLSVGIERSLRARSEDRRAEPPEPEEAPEPEPNLAPVPARPPIAVERASPEPRKPAEATVPPDLGIPEALVWVPFPTCAWTPYGEAREHLATLSPDSPFQIAVPGFVPRTVTLAESDRIELEPAPVQGSIVVLAAQGDVVSVGGHSVPADDAGVAILTAPVGPVRGEILGGGRSVPFELAVADGYALWLRVPPPGDLAILFDAGSAELTPESRAKIARIARTAGGWGLSLRGSYSPEGDPDANLRLARERGVAVRQALVEAGFPADRISEQEPVQPDAGLSLREQRRVDLVPVPAGGTP